MKMKGFQLKSLIDFKDIKSFEKDLHKLKNKLNFSTLGLFVGYSVRGIIEGRILRNNGPKFSNTSYKYHNGRRILYKEWLEMNGVNTSKGIKEIGVYRHKAKLGLPISSYVRPLGNSSEIVVGWAFQSRRQKVEGAFTRGFPGMQLAVIRENRKKRMYLTTSEQNIVTNRANKIVSARLKALEDGKPIRTLGRHIDRKARQIRPSHGGIYFKSRRKYK